MDTSEQGINLDAIRIDNVGRLDSQLHDLDDFEIPAKVSHSGGVYLFIRIQCVVRQIFSG
jgi:hypothetical protein